MIWIDVLDRRPARNDRVIVFDADGYKTKIYILLWGEDPDGIPRGVTHWMPLPEAPEVP